jgi:hypothetical protein
MFLTSKRTGELTLLAQLAHRRSFLRPPLLEARLLRLVVARCLPAFAFVALEAEFLALERSDSVRIRRFLRQMTQLVQ